MVILLPVEKKEPDVKMTILKERLNEANTSLEELLKKIHSISLDANVLAYITKYDNLGNSSSDIDIYVITSGATNKRNLVYRLGDLSLDIEFHCEKDIIQMIRVLNTERSNYDTIKFIYRLKSGCFLKLSDSDINWDQYLHEINIKKVAEKHFSVLANSLMEDAHKLYKHKEFFCSISVVRNAIQNAVSAFCFHYDMPCVNLKWISKMFLNVCKISSSPLAKEYCELMYYSRIEPSNTTQYIERCLNFVQKIMFELAM